MEEIKTEEILEESSKEEKKAKKASKKDTEKELLEEIEKLKADLAEKDDKYLRMAAEYENFRRRSREEKDATYEIALADTVSEFLPIIDNLERAAAYENSDAESLKKGLELTLKSFSETLEKMGVKEIEALGKTFDPNLHNAVMHVDDEAYGESEIVEVFAKGYARGDKVLRFSMVKVAN